MSDTTLINKLKSAGLYSDGHYRLQSGHHAAQYIQLRLAFMDRAFVDIFAATIARTATKTGAEAVAGFTMGGLLLAQAVAEKTQLPLIVGKETSPGVEWSAATIPKQARRVLLIDDLYRDSSQVADAAQSLEEATDLDLAGAAVAVARAHLPWRDKHVTFRQRRHEISHALQVPLDLWPLGECPLCSRGLPYHDLSDPERDFISVLLSQAGGNAQKILNGYRRIYVLQSDRDKVTQVDTWKRLLAGLNRTELPTGRILEEGRVIQFIRSLNASVKRSSFGKRVISELFGQVMNVGLMQIESRTIGCTIIVGDEAAICQQLEVPGLVSCPVVVRASDLSNLVPYFDGLDERSFVFVFSAEGELKEVMRLVKRRGTDLLRSGVGLLREVTERIPSLGLVLRRGRRSVAVYAGGRLEAVVGVSARTGSWEFSYPMRRVDRISKHLPRLPELSDWLAFLIEAALEMAAMGWGGLFVLGANVAKMEFIEPKVRVDARSLTDFDIAELAELAKLDGCVLVDKKGRVTHVSALLTSRGRDKDRTRRSLFGGARLEAARRTSEEHRDTACLYVSQNGAMEIFVKGQSWPILQGFSGIF